MHARTGEATRTEARVRRHAARDGMVVRKLRTPPTPDEERVFLVFGAFGGLVSTQWGMTLPDLAEWLDEPWAEAATQS